MIYTSSVREFKSFNCKANFLIVRSNKASVKGCVKFDWLAPPKELFFWYLNNRSKPNWFDYYSKQFNSHLRTSSEVQEGIACLREILKVYPDVCLVCFCEQLNQCHRKLVGAYLRELGFEVDIH